MMQLGIALQMYADGYRVFPPGATTRVDDPTKTHESIHGILVPYLEETGLASPYKSGQDWRTQLDWVPAVVLPFYSCQSSDGENPILDKLRNELLAAGGTPYPASQLYGTTNYVFCRGVTDAWCRCWLEDGNRVPNSERGIFDVNWSVRPDDVTDGLSKTIAAGEGADGPAWLLCDRTGAVVDRNRPSVADKYGMQRSAYQAWLAMDPATLTESDQGLRVASVLACTLEPLNKNPVTDSWSDIAALDDCRKSLPSAAGTRGPTTDGGPHTTPNFRSDHAGGANFLFADGSVQFLNDDIDMLLYQQLSTYAGGEAAEVPE
jgi:prepilin-type processing-associated H-X9-DG protein